MIRIILQVFCAIFSGFMEAFSISNEILPFGSPLLALFSLVPLYTATFKVKSTKEAFGLWFLQALTVHLVSSWWLANFHDFAIFTLGASALATAFMAGLCGTIVYIVPLYTKKSFVLEENGGKHVFAPFMRILWFTACYLFWEWCKSVDFLGYPWGTLSMAAYRWKIITQIADITGVWGISFLFCMTSALTGEGIRLLGQKTQPSVQSVRGYVNVAKGLCLLFSLTVGYGCVQYLIPRTEEKNIQTVLVQQNCDTWVTGEREAVRVSKELTENTLVDMRNNGIEPDLVLWSEGILQLPFPDYRFVYSAENEAEESLSGFINRMGVPFVIGGTVDVNPYKFHYTNGALFFDAGGNFCGFYSKMHLVPFAEEIPYEDNPLMKAFMENVVNMPSGWRKGNQFVLFTVPIQKNNQYGTPLEYRPEKVARITLDENRLSDWDEREYFIHNTAKNPDAHVSFSVPICFEDAFNDVCRTFHLLGSEVFMNITNDAWSASRSAEYQHFIAASYRAIEYRTTLVRCANSGYSVVVNPAGKIIQDLPLFETVAMSVSVPIYKHTNTIYACLGDWFIYTIIVFIALVILILFIFRIKPECKRFIKHVFSPRVIIYTEEKAESSLAKESHVKKVTVKKATKKVPSQKEAVKTIAKKSTTKKSPAKKSEPKKSSVKKQSVTKTKTKQKTPKKNTIKKTKPKTTRSSSK